MDDTERRLDDLEGSNVRPDRPDEEPGADPDTEEPPVEIKPEEPPDRGGRAEAPEP